MCSDGDSLPNSPATTKENTAGSKGNVGGSEGNVGGSEGETNRSSSEATSQPLEPSMNGTSVGMDCSSPVPRLCRKRNKVAWEPG